MAPPREELIEDEFSYAGGGSGGSVEVRWIFNSEGKLDLGNDSFGLGERNFAYWNPDQTSPTSAQVTCPELDLGFQAI